MNAITQTYPCPFCNKRNWRVGQNSGTHAMYVECCSCGARGPLTTPFRTAAIQAWNDRIATLDPLRVPPDKAESGEASAEVQARRCE